MKKILFLILGTSLMFACQSTDNKTDKKVDNQKVEKEPVSFDHKAYKMKGMIIAKTTFKTFKSQIQAIGSKNGLPAVVDFCHDNAQKLSDSIGNAHNVVIKRTSNKLRNEKNAPDADETAVIENYLRLQEDPNRPMEPIVMKDGEGFVHFYAPIKLKKACLKCHGIPEKEVLETILKILKEKYPHDKATGFREGELRGIWDIKFLDKP